MIRSFYAPETARSTHPNIGKDGGNPVKRVLSALLVLMLVLALLPASALAETPYTRADAAVYLAETFGLADIHASRIEGYETTPKEMGYSASSDAITAANVIAAAKDCVAARSRLLLWIVACGEKR